MEEQGLTARMWYCKFTVPPSPEGVANSNKRTAWAVNYSYAVSAPTLEEAVSKIRAAYPTAVVWSINHHGTMLL